MLRTLRNSAAVIVAAVALAGPVAAQTAAPAAPATPAAPAVIPAPAAPATAQATAPATPAPATATAETPPAAPATALPAALTDLGITDATVQPVRQGGQRAQGTLPGSGAFQAMLDDTGALRMIRVTDEAAALPADLVSRLVPEAVRANAIFAEITSVKGVAQGSQGVMVFGTDAQNQHVRAGFAADGTLQKFGRGEMDRGKDRKHWGGKDGKGKDGKGKRGDGKHGKAWDGKRGDGQRGGSDGQQGAAPAQLPAELDDAAVARIVTDAGYTQPGAVTRNGPRLEVEAVNPNGEPVTLTVNPRGVIVRELAR